MVNSLYTRSPDIAYKVFLDSGASCHVLGPQHHSLDKKNALNPLTARLPDGTVMHSTDTASLDIIHNLPDKTRKAHIFPNVKHALISLPALCDAGCKAIFDKDKVTITHNNNPIISGLRDTKSSLWNIDLKNKTFPKQATSQTTAFGNACELLVNHVDHPHTSTLPELMRFLHSACFSPVKSTLMKAIQKGFFTTWPGFATEKVSKHLPTSLATAQGHWDQAQKNRHSTQPSNSNVPDSCDNPLT